MWDESLFNALFLKHRERIEALGLVLLISRLIWRLIEHAMRTDLAARHMTLPDWDNKPTRRPSTYMMIWKFKGVIVLCGNQKRHLANPYHSLKRLS
jgi:transposase